MAIPEVLLSLIVIFAAAKIFGELAERIGQPAVLGEMLGGIVVGASGLHLIDPHAPLLHILSELGVILLLFVIGLETDIRKLLKVGGASASVALVGVILPLVAGVACGLALGYPRPVAFFLGAALTATSVGITARVLSDLGHLEDDESQVILGAAVIDDIIGLVLLTVAGGLAAGKTITTAGIAKTFAVAIGFVVVALVIGSILAPWLVKLLARLRVVKAMFFSAVMLAFALAWIADVVGSGMIIGAFAAGLILARTDRGKDIEHEVYDIAQFFIPIFFVMVGAAVDLRKLNPFDPASRPYFVIGLVLTAAGIIGKVAAGYAAFGRPLRKIVIGVGMVPRGEVGLIFAQLGLTTGLLQEGLYSSVALMVIITTFIAPPLLRMLLTKKGRDTAPEVCDLVTESMSDSEERPEDRRAVWSR